MNKNKTRYKTRYKTKMILAAIMAFPNFCYAADTSTSTVNTWEVVNVTGDISYADGAIIGVGPGDGISSGIEEGIRAANGPYTISSPGTITILGRPTPGESISYMQGLDVYRSGYAGTTELTVDSKLNVDMETAVKQSPSDQSLASGIHMNTTGASGGQETISKLTFNDDVNVNMLNKTETVSGSTVNKDVAEGVNIRSFRGGYNEATFKGTLKVDAAATVNGRGIYGIRFEDQVSDNNGNGTGSKLTFAKDVNLTTTAVQGNVWGMQGQTVGGKQTITFADDAKLTINAEQIETGGEHYTRGLILNVDNASRISDSDGAGEQNATFGGNVDVTAKGDYYASALSSYANYYSKINTESTQTIDFNKNLNLTADAEQNGYGLDARGIQNGSSTINVAGDTYINVKAGTAAEGIYQHDLSGAKSIINFKNVDVEATASNGNAYGVYQYAKGVDGTKSSIMSSDTAKITSVGKNAYTAYQYARQGADNSFTAKDMELIATATNSTAMAICQNAQELSSSNKISTTDTMKVQATGKTSAYGAYQDARQGADNSFTAKDMELTAASANGAASAIYQTAQEVGSMNTITATDTMKATASGKKSSYGVYQLVGYNSTTHTVAAGATAHVTANNLEITTQSEIVNAYGTYQYAVGSDTLATMTADGRTTIEATGTSGSAFGVYQVSLSGAQSTDSFKNGLVVDVQGTEAYGLYANADGAENSKSLITADGDIELTANEGSGYVAWATGEGSEINLNQEGQGKVNVTGYSLAESKGQITYNLNKANSSIVGNIYADTEGQVDLTMSGDNTLFDGAADNRSDNGNGNGIINIDMDNNSLWLMRDSSFVTNTRLNNGSVIDLSAAQGYQNLTTDNLSGNGGKFILDVDARTNVENSDQIHVTDTFDGEQFLAINETSGEENWDSMAAENTVLARVNNNKGTFKAVDSEGTLYYKRYELDYKDTDDTSGAFTKDWYLKRATIVDPEEKPTPGIDAPVAMGALAYYTWLDHDQLMKRMGDLRHKGEDEKGIWVRLKGAKIGRNGTFGFKNKYTHYELGYDEIMKETPKYTRYGGASISYADGDASYSRGNGDNNSRAVNFYMTEMGNKGHYLDVVLRFHHMDSNFKMFDESGKKIRGDMENLGVSLSGEYGRKKMLDDKGLYIEPQGQLTLGYLGGDNYTTSNGINVNQGGIRSALGRLGFNLGKDIDAKTNIYIKANLLHEFGGGYHATMTDSSGRVKIDRGYQDTWFEYGIGAAIQTGKNNHLYFDFERSTGGDFKKDWNWNVGARWTF